MGRLAVQFVKMCNLRTLLIIVTAWLLVNPVLPSWIQRVNQQVDQSLLRVALHFNVLPEQTTKLTIIHVPSLEYDHWLDDLPGASRLAQLLDKLYGQPEGVMPHSQLGLLLEQPFALIQSEAESLLADIQQGRRTRDHLFAQANNLLGRREKLLTHLKSNNVVLGLDDRLASQYREVTKVPSPATAYPPFIVDWLWPKPPQVTPDLLSPALEYSPIPSHLGGRQFLLVGDQESYIPTFWTQFLAEDLKVKEPFWGEGKQGIQWLQPFGVQIQNELIEASSDSGFIPVYGQFSGIRAPLRQITLGAALKSESLSGWILMGRDGSAQLEQVAQVLTSLNDRAYFILPVWWPIIEKLLLLMIAVLVLFVVPHVGSRWVVTIVLLLASLVMGLQLMGQILRNWWLPGGMLMTYLTAALAVMLVWRWQQQYWRDLLQRVDRASFELSQTLAGSGDWKRALEYAKECRNGSEVYEHLYSIAEALEDDQRWHEAVATWSELKRRTWRYRDVRARLKKAQQAVLGKDQKNKPSRPFAQPLASTQKLTSSPLSLPAFGRYQVREELGRGASGTVYLGFDPMIARDVAIKTIQYERFSPAEIEEVKARFFREAEAAGRLNHPSIVPVFDVGEQDGNAYIAMDFAKGQPLANYVHKPRLLPPFVVYRIALDVAEALAYAHDNKIVHRDIKPGNVLFNADPFGVRITDFGIARFVDHSHTRTGEILGSPLYMSPEQVLGQKVEASSDLFSLGVMFYQLLTGELPFSGESLAAVTYEIVHSKHKSARTVNKALPASATRITNTALQKKPADRFRSASEMADALRKAIKRDFAAEAKKAGLSI